MLCNASGIVAPNITWFHGNTEVEVKDRISASVGDSVILSDGLLSIVSELSISNVQLSDQGVYKCGATVDDFTADREIAVVIVQGMFTTSIHAIIPLIHPFLHDLSTIYIFFLPFIYRTIHSYIHSSIYSYIYSLLIHSSS